jgi:hypothetical protein
MKLYAVVDWTGLRLTLKQSKDEAIEIFRDTAADARGSISLFEYDLDKNNDHMLASCTEGEMWTDKEHMYLVSEIYEDQICRAADEEEEDVPHEAEA